MKKFVAAALVAAMMVSGCASRSKDIAAAYVSPAQYAGYSCDQIRTDLVRIAGRVNEVSGQQDRKATNDAVATGVAIVLFWPAIFFLMSDDHKEELSRLKGEYDALNAAAVEKHCDLAAQPAGAAH